MTAAGHEHGLADGRAGDIERLFHAHGLRVTTQRRRVVAALGAGSHLTPDEITTAVAGDGGDPLPASTVYRTLDTLEEIGIVSHTHLTHGAPTYHLADHPRHVHLVCRGCGGVESVPATLADDLTEQVRRRTGFAADIQHMGIHGTCARCLADATRPERPDAPHPEDR